MNKEEAIKRSQAEKFNYPDVFDINCGLGTFPELGVKGIPSWGRGTLHKGRYAILEIRTFKGISFDAIHYYGKLIIDGVYVDDIERPGYSKNLTKEQETQNPLLNYHYDLKIKRPLTRKEIEGDPKRWGDYYNEGDLIDGYEDMNVLIEDTKEIMRIRFAGDWGFFYETPRGQMQKITL